MTITTKNGQSLARGTRWSSSSCLLRACWSFKESSSYDATANFGVLLMTNSVQRGLRRMRRSSCFHAPKGTRARHKAHTQLPSCLLHSSDNYLRKSSRKRTDAECLEGVPGELPDGYLPGRLPAVLSSHSDLLCVFFFPYFILDCLLHTWAKPRLDVTSYFLQTSNRPL